MSDIPPRRSQREIAVPNDDWKSCQLPSHEVELPVVLVQDSIAGSESVDLEPTRLSLLQTSPTFATERCLREHFAGCCKCTHSVTATL